MARFAAFLGLRAFGRLFADELPLWVELRATRGGIVALSSS